MGVNWLSAEPAEGRSTQVWADSARNPGVWASAGARLPGWKIFGRFRLAGLDWGLRVDPDVGPGGPTQRAARPRLQGSRSPWR